MTVKELTSAMEEPNLKLAESLKLEAIAAAAAEEAVRAELTKKLGQAEPAAAKRARLVPSCRLAVTLTCFLGVFVFSYARMHTSVSVLCMVQHQAKQLQAPAALAAVNSSRLLDGAAGYNASVGGTSPLQPRGEFQWSKQFQGLVLSAYAYGYVAALIAGGWLADRYPSIQVACAGFLGQALTQALIPELTRLHSCAIIILRVLQGVAAAAWYPSFNIILRNWSLDGEFVLLFSIAWSGAYVGNAASAVSSGLCQSTFLGGWPAIYYLSAVMMLLWIALASVTITESPEDHRFVSSTERDCLLAQDGVRARHVPPPRPVSLWTLMRNLQVWIIALSHFGTSWNYAVFNTTLPTFMMEAYNFDIAQNGIMSALPCISMTVLTLLLGKVYDFIHVTKGVSATVSRKIMSVIGLVLPAILLAVVLALPESHRYTSVGLIALASGLSSIIYSSGPVSATKEIAPQYMGLIWGVASTVGNCSRWLEPLVAAAMTPHGTMQEWSWFFVIAIVMMVLLNALILFGWKSELQPFARVDRDEEAPPQKCELVKVPFGATGAA